MKNGTGSKFNELISSRLRLRRLQPGDAIALSNYRSLTEVARYQSWIRFTESDAVALIEEQAEAEPAIPGEWFQMAIVDRASGNLIGDCGLLCLKDDPAVIEIGISLTPSHQKRGYATETLACLIDFIFSDLKKSRIRAVTDEHNAAAIALFKRFSFRHEAEEKVMFKGRQSIEFVFTLPAPQNNGPR